MSLHPFPPVFVPAALLAAVCGLQAIAQDRPRGPAAGRDPAEMLSRADTDGDGKVSKAEFMAARSAEMEQAFGRIDADGDGFIDAREAEQVATRMREMAGREGPGRGDERGRRAVGERPTGEMAAEGAGQRPEALAEQLFDRMDTDGNGALSREEYLAGAARLREMMMRRGGQPGLGGRAGPPAEGFRRPPRQDAAGAPDSEGS